MTRLASQDQILDRVRDYVVTTFRDGRGDGLSPDTPLVTSGVVDSTGVLEVVEFLEREFGIRVQDEDVVLENFDSLRTITALVTRKLA